MKSWMWPSSEARPLSAHRWIGMAGMAGYALLAFAALLTFGQQAFAQPKTFHRIIIDTTPIADSGTRQLAENIKPMLAAGVMRSMGSFIDQRDRNAPTLVITVKALQLSAFGGAD